MEGWKKIVIGAGVASLAGLLGYYIYKKAKEHKADSPEDKPKEIEPVKISEEARGPRLDPVDIMDQVLVDSMDILIRYSKYGADNTGEDKQKVAHQIQENGKSLPLEHNSEEQHFGYRKGCLQSKWLGNRGILRSSSQARTERRCVCDKICDCIAPLSRDSILLMR